MTPTKEKKQNPKTFFITSTRIKIIMLYTRTSGHVGEYYGPNFSCTESISYSERRKMFCVLGSPYIYIYIYIYSIF